MSPSSGERKKANAFYFIKWVIMLLYIFQIHFVRSLMDVDGTDNMAALLQKNVLRFGHDYIYSF